MGFIILLLIVCVLIGLARAIIPPSDWDDFLSPFIISGLISSLIVSIVMMVSYESTISMKQRLANINAYKTTITAYVKTSKAFELKPGSEFTDLKYQNYQKQIADLLRDLRLEVVRYNNSLVGKTEFKQSFFWNWIIFAAPEGSQILKMSDYLE